MSHARTVVSKAITEEIVGARAKVKAKGRATTATKAIQQEGHSKAK